MTKLLVTLIVIANLACVVLAQRPVPSLTTDDIVSPSASPSGSPPAKSGEAGKVSAAKESGQKPEAKSGETGGVSEKDWNIKLKQAQERVADLDRRADQGEIEINDLRNYLRSAQERAPETNQQVLDKINKIAEAVKQLKSASADAQADVSRLMKDGNEQGLKVSEKPLTDATGAPDLAAISEASDKARQEVKDAQAKIDLLQVQLNGVQAGIFKAQTADSFALGKLRQDRERISDEIERNRSRIAELTSKLQDMQQKSQSVRPDGK